MALVSKVEKRKRKSSFREHSREESGHVKSHSPVMHGPFLACSSLVSSRDFLRYQMGSRK